MIKLPKSFGGHGATVVLFRRGKVLYLRWWNGKRWEKQSLKHNDMDKGDVAARAKSAERMTQRKAVGPDATVAQLISVYSVEVSAHKPHPQDAEDRRRADLWTVVLGDLVAADLTRFDVDGFVRDRRAGTVVFRDENGRNRLRKKVAEGTIGSDIVYLESVLNWAVEKKKIVTNPLKGFDRPTTAQPRRPVATYDRYLALMKVAAKVHPRFPALLTLAEAVGWRLSGIRTLRGEDFDRTKRSEAPYGRIRKKAEHDKQRVDMWVPLTKAARKAMDRLHVITGPLFPAERTPSEPWHRRYCATLLSRAEKLAGLERLNGSAFHAYRRAWATERKGLPLVDVAAAGGWRDTRTLERIYQQTDPQTMLAVVLHEAKLRDVK